MEKKVKVTIEISEEEIPIILGYSHHLAKGFISFDSSNLDDKKVILGLCDHYLPSVKSIFYQLTGETLKTLRKTFHEIDPSLHEAKDKFVSIRSFKKWLGDSLDYQELGYHQKEVYEYPLENRIINAIHELQGQGWKNVSIQQIQDILTESDLDQFSTVFLKLIDSKKVIEIEHSSTNSSLSLYALPKKGD